MITFPQQQPIRFNVLDVICNCNSDAYSQLINTDDITHYQMELDACGDAIELLVNGGFVNGADIRPWDLVSGVVSVEVGELCYDPSGGTARLQQDVLSPDRYYKVSLSVSEMDTGGVIFLLLGTNSIAAIREPGDYTFYGFNDALSTTFELQLREARACIDNVSIKEVDLNITVAIIDENDVVQHERLVVDSIESELGELGVDINFISDDKFQLARQWLTGFIDWSSLGLPLGCYRIAILDNCENTNGQTRIPNGEFEWPSEQEFYPGATPPLTFETDQPWEITENLSTAEIIGGRLDYNGAAFGNVDLCQTDLVAPGIQYRYEISFTLSGGTGSVTMQYGTATGTTYTTGGTYLGAVVSDGTDMCIKITGDARIDIQYVRHSIPTEDYFINHEGVQLTLGNHECTTLINGCNNTDVFEMGFVGTGFNPTIRLEAKVVRAQYDFERELGRRSDGNFRVNYFDRIKRQVLRIERQPEYVHDFLSLMPGFDHWYVNRVEYVVAPEEEYIVEYDDELDDIGSVDIIITEKQKLIRNVACGEDTGGCALPPNVLLLENGFALTQEDGSFILING